MHSQRRPPRAVLVASLCLALVAGTTFAQASQQRLRLPRQRALQDTTIKGCEFTKGKGLVSDAFVNLSGYVLATPQAATDCLNQIRIGYDFAYESVTNLAQIFNQSYVFVALAANPPYGQAFSALVYNYSVDVPGELQALADSWPEGASVGLADLQFTVIETFHRLKDAHVTVTGSGGGSVGTMLGNAVRNATEVEDGVGDGRAYLLDSVAEELLIGLEVAKDKQGRFTLRGKFFTPNQDYAYRTFQSINGKSPMEYFVALADNVVLNLPYKPPGTRFNQLLSLFEYFRVHRLGRLTKLPADASVVYAGGTKGKLAWGVTFAPTVSAERLQKLQDEANTPGVPFRALLKAAQTYAYGDTAVSEAPAVPPSPAVSTLARPEVETRESRRRRLQTDGALPYEKLKWIGGTDNTDSVGFYYVNKTTAVLKLNSFDFDTSTIQSFWPLLVADAQKAGAKQLLLDLTGNGGGTVEAGLSLALGLFPSASYGDLGLRYDRICGEDAVYAYRNSLQPTKLSSALQDITGKSAALQARIKAIMSNATDFKRLVRKSQVISSALTVLINSASEDQTQACNSLRTGFQVSCKDYWKSLRAEFDSLVNDISKAGKLTATNLDALVGQFLPKLLLYFWPYTGAPGDDNSDPYATPELAMRGGKPRYYTAKFDLLGLDKSTTARDYFPNLPSNKPQFTKILAVSDGYCGSTCDTFSRTAYFYSRRNSSAPVFRYLTFGGTGNANDASATAYPGGNVNGDDFVTSAWAYNVIAQLSTDWAGLPALTKKLVGWADLLPIFPAFLDSFTPGYTQSEIFQVGAIGDSLPTEYIKIPTDYYAPVWYQALDLPSESSSGDLPALYATAASVLASMPGPKPSQG